MNRNKLQSFLAGATAQVSRAAQAAGRQTSDFLESHFFWTDDSLSIDAFPYYTVHPAPRITYDDILHMITGIRLKIREMRYRQLGIRIMREIGPGAAPVYIGVGSIRPEIYILNGNETTVPIERRTKSL